MAANVLQGNRHALAATQDTINFQARLETAAGAIVPDGLYNVQFKLYGASTGGSALWTETYYDSNGVTAGNDNRVTVTNGYLTVNLGSQTAFSGINWDQQLWLTMNIGGTAQTATPTYDGEMNPRLKLTAVPYAFRAGQLAQYNGVTGYSSTLSIANPTGGNQSFVIPDQGAAGTYNLLTTATAATGFVQLQGSTPGTAQTGNLNITGTGTFGKISLPNGTSTSLGISFASGTGIYGGTSSVNIADGFGGTIASFVSGGESSINSVSSGLAANRFRVDISGSSSSAFLVQNAGTDLSVIRGDGTARIKSAATGTPTLVVQGAASQTANLFEAQNSGGTVLAKIDNNGVITGAGLQAPTVDTASAGSLTIGGTNATSISIGKAGVSTTMLGALGLGTTSPQTTSALTIANGSWISAVDAAGTGYINMFQVNGSNQIQVGAALNIDGGIVLPTNGGQLTFSDLPIDSSASAGTPESYTMRVGSTNALTVYGESDGSGGVQNVRVAVGSSIAPAYTLDVGGDINTTGSYRINGTQICTSTGCVVSSTSGVQLQGATPGTAQTGNFNVTGTGIAGILQATTFDTATAVSMNVGTTNATSINLNQNTYVASGKSLGVRTTAPSEALTVNGNFNVRDADTPTKQYRFRTSGSNLDLEGAGASIYISVWSGANFTGTQYNKIILENSNNTQLIKTIQFRDTAFGTVRHTVDGTVGGNVTFNSDGEATDFSVQGDTDVNLLYVKGSTDRVGIGTNTPGYKLDINGTANATTVQAGSGGFTTSGSLVFTGTTTVNYTTPVGSNIPTRISLPNYNPGAYGQIIALGLPSTADATARAITVLDARSVAHQPSIAVLSPNETQIGGFSWEGTNDTLSVKNTANNISLNAAGQSVLTAKYLTSTTSSVTIGAPSSLQGSLIFSNSTNNYGIVLQAGTPTGDYTIQFANAIGSANQCLSIATIAGNVQTLGYTGCLSSTTGVQLQGSTPGTAQTGNFNITGTGIAGSLQASSLDTASAGTLTIGGMNATAITVTPSTTFNSTLISHSNIIINGTFTTTDNYRLQASGTLSSNATSSQYGFQNQVVFNPTGASLSAIYGLVNTPTISGSSLNITNFYGSATGISTGAGYTGTVANGAGLNVVSPTISGSNLMTTYQAILVNTNSANGGNTSGTITNYQVRVSGITAGAGTGGTVNNYGIRIDQPSGSGGTTNNYGLYIQGSGGGTTNYSIYNASSAATYLGNSTLIQTTSSTAFQIQNAGGTATYLAVDSSAGTITLGNGSNTMTIGSTGEPILAGTARHTKAIVLTPEYAGAVLDATNDAACSSNNNGTMTSGYQTGISGFGNANQNYYKWTATSASTQCYDVVIQVPVPSDWAAWTSSPMTVNGYVSSTSNGGLKATVYDSGGFLDTNWNVRAVTPGSASTWTTSSSAAFTAGGGYTAGSYMTIVVRMESKSNADTRLGNITLNYYSKY